MIRKNDSSAIPSSHRVSGLYRHELNPSVIMKLAALTVLIFAVHAHAQSTLRSSLYPENWTPSFVNPQGKFLHDFSYAGYHKSERPLPTIAGPITDVTQPPFSVDPTGKIDATSAIQKALDAVGAAGGGVVYLPPGTYNIKWQGSRPEALILRHSNVILRGAGLDKTHLFLDETVSRGKTMLFIRPDNAISWLTDLSGISVTRDILLPTRTIPLESVAEFAPGDNVILRSDTTDAFIEELGMTGKWKTTNTSFRGIILKRTITAVDPVARTVTLDAPTRFPMKLRDNLRLGHFHPPTLREVGLEDFSFGMRQNPLPGYEENDYINEAAGAYHVHGSVAIMLNNCENSWLRNVATYRPPENSDDIHLHSNAIRIHQSRQVTILDCNVQRPQSHAGGGNGYGYTLHGADCLVQNSTAAYCRHNFDIATMTATGNVIHNCFAKAGILASDFHSHFSTANLIDSLTCDGDHIECMYRPWGGTPVHGNTGSQNVFWNTKGLAYGPKRWIVRSKQWGDGYTIGTQGPASDIAPDSQGFLEHVGQSDKLQPPSLYIDQLNRRLTQPR